MLLALVVHVHEIKILSLENHNDVTVVGDLQLNYNIVHELNHHHSIKPILLRKTFLNRQ